MHFTDSVSTGGRLLQSLRPSVSTPSFEPTDLWAWSFACVARRGLKLKVTGQGQNTFGLTSILDRGQFSSFGCNCFLFDS